MTRQVYNIDMHTGVVYAVWDPDAGFARCVDPDTREAFTQDGATGYAATVPGGRVLVSEHGTPYRAPCQPRGVARLWAWLRRR